MRHMRGLRLYFDYVDPISYLLDTEVTAAAEGPDAFEVTLLPLEVRPPPVPLLDPDGPWWRERWAAACAITTEIGGPALVEPTLLPWSRKAHELVAQARRSERGRQAHRAVFRAMFEEGRDIGRVDVLVEIGVELGLDRTETKAVLDVDRHASDIAASRAAAIAVIGPEPPVLALGDRILRGFHNRDAVRTFVHP